LGEITWGTATATLAVCLVLVLPGGALLSLLLSCEAGDQPRQHFDAAAWLILAAGLTLALAPVALLALYLLGLRIGPGLVLGGLALSAALILWRQGPAAWTWLRRRHRLDVPLLALGLVALLILGSRLWAVRGLNYGLWGDSFQHTMIVQLIQDHGGLFQSWAPYAPLRTFTYHFGFHANVAFFQWASDWLTGNTTPRNVVLVGQFLNTLAALSLYPLAVRLSGRRWAGVAAVGLAGLLMPMPAFYINWGRYTQLTAQAMLPAVLWFLLEALDGPQANSRAWLLTGLALGGLGLTHLRVVFFVPCFLLPYLAWRLWRDRRDRQNLGRLGAGLAVVGGISLLIVAPWLWNLFNGAYPAIAAAVVAAPDAGETLNQAYLFHEIDWYVPWSLAALGVLGAALALLQRRAMSLVVAWLGLLFLLANPHWLGLPGTGLVDNFTLFLGLYLPVSLLAGFLVGEGVEFAAQRWRPAGAVALLLVVAVGLAGARARAAVVEPGHQMMTEADAAAMAWIRANTPPEARFLVNSFFAFSDHYIVGSDGGWWIPLLAGRDNTVPPLLYSSEAGPDPDYIARVNALARYVEDADLADGATVAWLREQGITHVYIGAQSGRVNDPDSPLLDAALLQASSYYRVVYHQDGVWIFELDPEGGSGD